jgi:hypothetical protein
MTRSEAMAAIDRLTDEIDRYRFNCPEAKAELEALRKFVDRLDAPAAAPKRKRRRAA